MQNFYFEGAVPAAVPVSPGGFILLLWKQLGDHQGWRFSTATDGTANTGSEAAGEGALCGMSTALLQGFLYKKLEIQSQACPLRKSSLPLLLLWATFSSRADWFSGLWIAPHIYCRKKRKEGKTELHRVGDAEHTWVVLEVLLLVSGRAEEGADFGVFLQCCSHRQCHSPCGCLTCFVSLGKRMCHTWRNQTMWWIMSMVAQRKQKSWSETKSTIGNLPFSRLCWGPLGHTS